ncbi:MBL fold metallo-hydrolase [Kaarinaea lacus]
MITHLPNRKQLSSAVIFVLTLLFAFISSLALAHEDSDNHDGFDQSDRYLKKDKGDILAVDKVKGDFSVMVLGSGGPIATEQGRASAGYLIFIDGKPKILMDAGGGTFQRLAASGTDVKDLDIVLLSHLHIDHMGDLSPIIKTVYFHNRAYNLANPGTFPPGRTAPILIFGPATNGIPFPANVFPDADPTIPQYPNSSDFADSHYEFTSGNERYLHIFSRAISGGIFDYEATDIPAGWTQYNETKLPNMKGVKISAVGVNHGPVPALAYRIEYKGKSIVFSGDTSSRSTLSDGTPLANGGNMVEISSNADLLIYDTAIMDDEPSGPNDAVFFALHTTPSRIGEVATAANVRQVLLSHLTRVTQDRVPEIKQLILNQGYKGILTEANDLQVINLLDHSH